MRNYEFLPYEKAIEAMAREYAKVKPIRPLQEEKEVEVKDNITAPPFNSFLELENTYCYNLEIIMLLRQLRMRINRQDLIDNIDHLNELKTEITKRLEVEYHNACGKYPPAPVVGRIVLPAILRRLLYLQSSIVNSNNRIMSDYPALKSLEQDEIKASLILDNIIIIITSL